jgi:hypothetical protein
VEGCTDFKNIVHFHSMRSITEFSTREGCATAKSLRGQERGAAELLAASPLIANHDENV